MRRILAGLLAAMLGVSLGLSAAQPASANLAGFGCNDVGALNARVCLYNYLNYNIAYGFWQRTFAEVREGCVNLANHRWHTGGSVNDAASSLIITLGAMYDYHWRVRVYNWTSCSSANGYREYEVRNEGYERIWDLKNVGIDNWIGSVQIFSEPN